MTSNLIRVMLVDDEPNTIALIKLCIDWKALGFEILYEASNGKEALKILKEQTVDVVITDIEMPFFDGIELSREIKKAYSNIIVIILTAYDSFEYAKSAIKIGVNDFILKPINRSELKETLHRIREHIQKTFRDPGKDQYSRDFLPYNKDNISYKMLNGGEYDKFYKLVSDTFDRLIDSGDIARARYHCRAILNMLRSYLNMAVCSDNIMVVDDRALIIDNIALMVETVNSYVLDMVFQLKLMKLRKENAVLSNIICYIQDHVFDESVSLGSVSARFFINPSYLSRIITQQIGLSFVDFVNTLRIERAKNLLRNSDMKAYEISQIVGFVNPNYFSKCFKKYTGESISEYKNKFFFNNKGGQAYDYL
jgi:two-component system response regulator YesN